MSKNPIWRRIVKTIVAAALAYTTAGGFSAVAQAGADGPTVSSSKFITKAAVSGVDIQGRQGASGGGGGGGRFGKFKLGGDGKKAKEAQPPSLDVGRIDIKGGTVSGTEILQDVSASNVRIDGASVTVGTTTIGGP